MTEDTNSHRTETGDVTDDQTDATEAPPSQPSQQNIDAAVPRMLASMSSRQRRKQLRAYRKQARREKWCLYRQNWIDQQIDRRLPDSIERKLPPWVYTSGGRWVIIGFGLIAVLFWTLLAILLIV